MAHVNPLNPQGVRRPFDFVDKAAQLMVAGVELQGHGQAGKLLVCLGELRRDGRQVYAGRTTDRSHFTHEPGRFRFRCQLFARPFQLVEQRHGLLLRLLIGLLFRHALAKLAHLPLLRRLNDMIADKTGQCKPRHRAERRLLQHYIFRVDAPREDCAFN